MQRKSKSLKNHPQLLTNEQFIKHVPFYVEVVDDFLRTRKAEELCEFAQVLTKVFAAYAGPESLNVLTNIFSHRDPREFKCRNGQPFSEFEDYFLKANFPELGRMN